MKQEKFPETGQNLTGEARYRHKKREAATFLLSDLDPQDAAVICATVLDFVGAGAPRLDYLADVREEAESWVYCANVAELEAYYSAIAQRLEQQPLGIRQSKRIFWALWNSFPDKECRAFLDRVNRDGRILGGSK